MLLPAAALRLRMTMNAIMAITAMRTPATLPIMGPAEEERELVGSALGWALPSKNSPSSVMTPALVSSSRYLNRPLLAASSLFFRMRLTMDSPISISYKSCVQLQIEWACCWDDAIMLSCHPTKHKKTSESDVWTHRVNHVKAEAVSTLDSQFGNLIAGIIYE